MCPGQRKGCDDDPSPRVPRTISRELELVSVSPDHVRDLRLSRGTMPSYLYVLCPAQSPRLQAAQGTESSVARGSGRQQASRKSKTQVKKGKKTAASSNSPLFWGVSQASHWTGRRN